MSSPTNTQTLADSDNQPTATTLPTATTAATSTTASRTQTAAPTTNFPYADAGMKPIGGPPLVVPFHNQPHANPHREDAIVGTYGMPSTPSITGNVHEANCICQCGQYHSVLSDKAERIRLGYRHIMSGGTFHDAIAIASKSDSGETGATTTTAKPGNSNPFFLMIQVNQYLGYWSQTDPEAFGEVIEDEIRRKRLHVAEEPIELQLDSVPIECSTQRDMALDAVEQMVQVNHTIAPIIQQKWDQQQQQEEQEHQCDEV